MQSGKSINENLAQQFKNSIPLRQDEILSKMVSEDGKAIYQEDMQVSANGEATSIPHDTLNSPLKLTALKSEPVPTILNSLVHSEQKSV